MSYKATVTKKGQITIPKKIRKALGIDKSSQVEVELDKREQAMKVKSIPDLSEVKGLIKKPKQGVLKAREKMEKEYQP